MGGGGRSQKRSLTFWTKKSWFLKKWTDLAWLRRIQWCFSFFANDSYLKYTTEIWFSKKKLRQISTPHRLNIVLKYTTFWRKVSISFSITIVRTWKLHRWKGKIIIFWMVPFLSSEDAYSKRYGNFLRNSNKLRMRFCSDNRLKDVLLCLRFSDVFGYRSNPLKSFMWHNVFVYFLNRKFISIRRELGSETDLLIYSR